MCARSVNRFFSAPIALAAALLLAGCGGSSSHPHVTPADTVYTNATVETMDGSMSTAQAVAITGDQIVAVGSMAAVKPYIGSTTQVVDLQGATVLPGFIDSHSHMMGLGFYSDRANWLDVSSINTLFKPPPNDPRCTAPTDPQVCFIPVQTQDDVIQRLTAAVASAPAPDSTVLAFNYDPSRLGHSKDCPGTGIGFACPNFEDGTARQTLDAISATHPILISSESGHITYVNTPMLRQLNVCGTDVATENCHEPTINPPAEQALAQLGQLDEDLALWAIGVAQAAVIHNDPFEGVQAVKRAVSIYQQHGFTFVQEGAATTFLVGIYALATLDPDFPATAAMFVYDPNTADISVEIEQALRAKAAIKDNPNMIIAAVKAFADGSNQGYTGFLSTPYFDYFYPFNDALFAPPTYFEQPYVGLPDFDQAALATAFTAAHQAGLALAIHQNGEQAIAGAVQALEMAGTVPGIRDFLVHFTLASPADVSAANRLGAAVTFLPEDIYYWGLQGCQQVLGSDRTPSYPAGDAAALGMRFGLHSDTPVTPGYPLFAIWTAKTRATQQPPWYPNTNPAQCPVVASPQQAISIAQGLKAYTIDAAWLYGLEDQLGSIETGKIADLVILSENPLAMENNPDGLKNIRVLGTVHRGKSFANPHANEPPIWPG